MSTAAVASAVSALPAPGKGEITPENLKASQDSLNAKLNDPTVRQDIRAELQQMGENVVGMENDFAKVYSFLKHLDSLGVLRYKDGKVMTLAPEWKEMHDEYTKLMNSSQQTAVKVNVQISDLLDIFLPYVENNKVSGAKKEKKLGQYIQDLNEFVADGTDHGNGFLRLREKVQAFQDKLHREIPNQLADVEAKLREINEKIKKLQEELKIIADFLNKSWYKVGNTSGITGLINLAPKSILPIVGKIFSLFGSNAIQEVTNKTAEKEVKEKQLKTLKEERDALNERRAHLEEALKALNVLDSTFASLIGRLSAMEGIWRMLAADALTLKEGLAKINKEAEQKLAKPKTEDDSDDEEDDLIFLNLRLQSIKAVYSALRVALDTYALSVAPAQKS